MNFILVRLFYRVFPLSWVFSEMSSVFLFTEKEINGRNKGVLQSAKAQAESLIWVIFLYKWFKIESHIFTKSAY